MNLLLLEAAEIVDGRATLRGRRAVHVREVLQAAHGEPMRAGVIGGAIGSATVIADDGDAIELAVAIELAGAAAPAPMPVALVLALPRPKVLGRVLEAAASFGVARIDVVNAWRVDKSYFGSPACEPAAIAERLRTGAEQGMTTRLPPVQVHRRLMAWFDELGDAPGLRLCAHARGGAPIERAWRRDDAGAPAILAIGPEGGWIDREVETFAARGFAIVSLGDPILRTEVAVAAALGQLALLLRR